MGHSVKIKTGGEKEINSEYKGSKKQKLTPYKT